MTAPGGRLPRAIVFDLDGTLVDSLPDITAALNSGLDAVGLATLPGASVRQLVGGGIGKLVERALEALGATGDADLAERLRAAVVAAYAARPCVETTLFPGSLWALDSLSSQGVALGLCTNKLAPITETILVTLGVRNKFQSVVGAAPGLALKPAPDMLLKVLADLGVSPAEALMVGDSAADVGTARAAGVKVVVVPHGYSKVPPADLGADRVIDGFAELEEAARELA